MGTNRRRRSKPRGVGYMEWVLDLAPEVLPRVPAGEILLAQRQRRLREEREKRKKENAERRAR